MGPLLLLCLFNSFLGHRINVRVLDVASIGHHLLGSPTGVVFDLIDCRNQLIPIVPILCHSHAHNNAVGRIR
jgi:hypothetical protein